MLDTLIKLGKQASQNLGEWDDILDKPKINVETKKGDKIKNYVGSLISNLDTGIFGLGEVVEYDEDRSAERYFNLKIQGGNNKAIYTCVEPKKFEQLRKSFFGKPDKNGEPATQGQFIEAIDKDFPELTETELYETLQAMFALRSGFEEEYLSEKGEADAKQLPNQWGLKPSEQVALLAVGVIWSEKGWNKPTYFKDIDGYQDFLRAKFTSRTSETELGEASSRLCYATGETKSHPKIYSATIRSKPSVTEMFVTTTKNYSSSLGLTDECFRRSYQIGEETNKYLEKGANILLDKYRTRIANVYHLIVPQLLSYDKSNIEANLGKISKNSDLLFRHKQYEEMVLDIEDEIEGNPYWITFLGYDSDGKSFKTVNIIKDVSRTHFENLIREFRKTNSQFKDIEGINWENVMSKGKDNPLEFNLYTVYELIPLRKDKEKKNAALALFKQILEKRPIEKEKLFGYFKDLILCHKFERYASYTNIYGNTPFDFAIRNAVFQYLALFQVLEQFNLIKNMEEVEDQSPEQEENLIELSEYQKKVEAFFDKMSYNDSQKALFYLGRVLNTVAYEQYRKGYESKPVLNKLNYNGMDKDDIARLRRDLAEKTQQFKLHGFTEPLFNRFTPLFNYNNWSVKPDEALFFILSGYSFNPKKSS